MSESDASEMSEMSETHDLPKKDVDEVWRTKTSGIYHTRRCAAIKNADTVLTRNREALTRHCNECGLCADESPNMRYESRCELDEINHLADDEVCVSKTALDKKSIKTYHTEACTFLRRYDTVFGIIKADALPDAATECQHCVSGVKSTLAHDLHDADSIEEALSDD